MSRRWCDDLTARIISETDERLEQNVDEYLHNLPLSGIRIGEYTVTMVMGMNRRTGFWKALEKLSVYAKDPARGIVLIREGRR